jgi:hypothetical protein
MRQNHRYGTRLLPYLMIGGANSRKRSEVPSELRFGEWKGKGARGVRLMRQRALRLRVPSISRSDAANVMSVL